MAKTSKEWAYFLYDGEMIEVVLLFSHELFAEHSEIVNGIILYHIEDIFFESKAVAI